MVPKVTGIITTAKIDVSSWPIQLADPEFYSPERVDMLIGASKFFSLLRSGQLRLADGLPELQETHFGWVVHGEINDGVCSNLQLAHFASLDTLSETIAKFWEMEEVSEPTTPDSEQDECEKMFVSTHHRTPTGRYVVRLPFREESSMLQDNRALALHRFLLLEKRLIKNVCLKH